MKSLILPPPSIDIIPGPIVLYTEIDARRAVSQCPIVLRPDHQNVVATLTMTDPKLLNQRSCIIIITHHVKSNRTGKMKVAGSWQIQLPIVGTDEDHIFKLTWPTEQQNGTERNGVEVPSPQ